MVKFGGEIGTVYQISLPALPSPNTNGHLLDFWGGPIACQDAEGFFTGVFPNTYTYTTLMVKFGGEIGTLYQMLKNAFIKHPLQNRTNVQIKGGGVKGLLNNVQKNCTFLKGWLPLLRAQGCIVLSWD